MSATLRSTRAQSTSRCAHCICDPVKIFHTIHLARPRDDVRAPLKLQARPLQEPRKGGLAMKGATWPALYSDAARLPPSTQGQKWRRNKRQNAEPEEEETAGQPAKGAKRAKRTRPAASMDVGAAEPLRADGRAASYYAIDYANASKARLTPRGRTRRRGCGVL